VVIVVLKTELDVKRDEEEHSLEGKIHRIRQIKTMASVLKMSPPPAPRAELPSAVASTYARSYRCSGCMREILAGQSSICNSGCVTGNPEVILKCPESRLFGNLPVGAGRRLNLPKSPFFMHCEIYFSSTHR
jgi:hypothetical protein